MKRLIRAIAVAAMLSGCQAGANLAAVPVAPQAAPLKALPDNAVRHLLSDSANDACIWAVQYSQSIARNSYPNGSWGYGAISGSATLVGKGNLIRASYNRYVYQVPDDQVLVINHLRGNGSLSLDGYGVSAASDVHYVFGAGELVVIRFDPATYTAGNTSDGCVFQSCWDAYYDLNIEGFTVSPSMLGGVSSMLASESK